MSLHLIATKTIAIVGGGPAGLTAARLLQQAGTTVTVYERDAHAEARLLGGSLDIHRGAGQRALARAGLLETFFAVARPAGNRMADKLGNVLFEMLPTGDDATAQPEIDRPELRTLLLDSLASGTVVWDRQVQAVTKRGEQFELTFQTGTTALADLVIVADGAMSKARQFITAQAAEYTGTYVIQGEVYEPARDCPAMHALANGGNLGAIEDKRGLFLHTKNNGHLSYYAMLAAPAGWLTGSAPDFRNLPATTAYLHELFAGWASPYHELLAVTNEYQGLPLRAVLLREPWPVRGNITAIGDAAHAMPPFGGQGANLGLVDALTLVECLTNAQCPDLPAAIAAYEQAMFAYAQPIQQEALAADERIRHAGSAAERVARVAKIMESRQQASNQ